MSALYILLQVKHIAAGVPGDSRRAGPSPRTRVTRYNVTFPSDLCPEKGTLCNKYSVFTFLRHEGNTRTCSLWSHPWLVLLLLCGNEAHSALRDTQRKSQMFLLDWGHFQLHCHLLLSSFPLRHSATPQQVTSLGQSYGSSRDFF